MSDRKEERFDFESDIDEELFSGADKKNIHADDSMEDLDLLDADSGLTAVDSKMSSDKENEEDEFAGLGDIQDHANQDFNQDMFDPNALDMEESHEEQPAPAPEAGGLAGLVQKVKDSWPYYLGAGCAVLFGIYLVSVILSGTSGEQAKAAAQANAQKNSANTKSLGLTLQDTNQFKGTLTLPEKQQPQAMVNDNMMPAKLPEVDANGSVTMDKQDMAKLLQGFSQAVNTSVEKIAVGKEKEMSGSTMDEMKKMRKSIEMLVERIDKYEQNLAKLDGSLAQLTTQLNLLVAQKTAQSDNLNLRAVVPGRAWLVDAQGRTYTVTEGDLVGNFGKIIQIDATAGRVVTSSGYVFN